MVPLTLAQFDAASAAYDRDVARTPGIDVFCSAGAWVVPAHEAFGPTREPWIFRGPAGWLALARARGPRGSRVLQPLEPVWGFASPLAGADPEALASDAVALLAARASEWDALIATGLTAAGAFWNELVRRLAPGHRLFRGPSVLRHRASLAGGVDGFLARRSRNLRRGLSRAARAARARGVVVEPAQGPPGELYARVLAVEAKSWKGLAGSGLAEEPMRGFYARMVPRLAARGALRLLFARLEGRDVGYVLGGVLAGTYRGLQFSHDARLRELGLGNLLQLAQVEALCAEGVGTYDLGCDLAYKARWAEAAFETSTLVVAR